MTHKVYPLQINFDSFKARKMSNIMQKKQKKQENQVALDRSAQYLLTDQIRFS